MKKSFFQQRANVNKAIAGAVVIHLLIVVLAARFNTVFFSTAAFYSAIALYIFVGPALWLWHRATKQLDTRGALDSIVDTTAQAEQLEKYNPITHFDLEKGLFVGLNIDDGLQPIYAPWKEIRSAHMQVLGPTGFGKGVATTMMLAQCAASGECVVIFDPKFPGDEYASRVLNQFTAQRGIPFYLINLSPEVPKEWETDFTTTPPQLNLFRGCSASQLNELLSTAFNLADTGKSDAHFRLHDRVACQDVCDRAAASAGLNVTIKDLVTAANKSKKIDDDKGADFKVKLEEICKLPVLLTATGHDLATILNQNAILYIVGSIRDPQATAVQKMLLLRIMQIIEQRNRNLKLRPVAMMLDELKYMLSAGVLQALGAVRDKGCHIMLAHQTNGDLEDCGGLPPVAVVGAVQKNTTKKLIYQVTDEDAEWASGLSGTIVVQQKSSHMQQGLFHAAEGQFREMERPFLTENQLKAMPKMTGMLYGFGLAKRVQVSPMPFGDWPKLTVAPALQETEKQPKDPKKPQEQPANAAAIAVEEPPANPQTNTSAATAKDHLQHNEDPDGTPLETATELDNLI